MTSKKETTVEKTKVKRVRPTNAATPTAAEKAQAVLAIWTERVKPAEVMRTMGINYVTLQQWQERGMEGMLQALESRTNLADGAALSPRAGRSCPRDWSSCRRLHRRPQPTRIRESCRPNRQRGRARK